MRECNSTLRVKGIRGDKLGLIRSIIGLPFKAYAVILAPVAIICPPVATIALGSWAVGAGISGDGQD